ncbi:MAG: OadG family protein [Oscillospiraceae bacterium]|jgi:sodium pump decarboxylase gamma subunit|nr:OadG family protein [Oscillospiraceae bacterium]
MEPSIPFVILMGIGVVFFGLICIILLCMAMSAICRSMGDKTPAPAPAAAAAPAAPAQQAIPNRQAMVAAIAVAVAEEMGTDPAGIRILSIKKL